MTKGVCWSGVRIKLPLRKCRQNSCQCHPTAIERTRDNCNCIAMSGNQGRLSLAIVPLIMSGHWTKGSTVKYIANCNKTCNRTVLNLSDTVRLKSGFSVAFETLSLTSVYLLDENSRNHNTWCYRYVDQSSILCWIMSSFLWRCRVCFDYRSCASWRWVTTRFVACRQTSPTSLSCRNLTSVATVSAVRW